MKFTNLLTVGALTASLVSPAIMAADTNNTTPMSDAQKKEIEKVVHDYLVANPEVLLEASQALQQKQQQNMQQQAQSAIKENTDQLFLGKTTIVGNPKGNVTIVEFFDYQCIHCKKMSPIIDSLIKKDSDLRVVYKEFPIFGKSSELASRAALAAGMQGKYQEMHNALIGIDKRLNDQIVMATAKSLGLDMKKLKTDMQSKEVTAILDANRELAEKLHLMGTPAFIIASTPNGQFKTGSEPSFIPGAASEESLQELIKKAAGNS
ncbi:DsbA family protein [Legionella sp. PATHC035]|uniref:DsbA family protein n=1 Tax=Legionella TaxID=445 RepID=UPI0022431285|nr:MULTISPECIES: DsbA family protein [unclassified Legionella]MCW8397823.1 DsbA family protein [Legionella sp. PATHC038]MCW8410240.1 DsbA family protein [Legionella sp. PATHC035]